MNWKECAQLAESMGAYTRFEWPRSRGRLGFDCNPDAFTINDLMGGAAWLWTWPGDYFLRLPTVQSFFELGGEPILGNGWSYVFPFVLYIVGGGILVVSVFAFLELVEAIGRILRHWWHGLRVLVCRVLRALRIMPPPGPQGDPN